MEKVFKETVKLLSNGEPLTLATVIQTKGSTPQKPGAKLLVRKDGSAVGTLGGGCVEGDIWFAAKELMKNKGPAEYRDYFLNEELAAKDGLVCGGTMYFLIDPVYEPKNYLPYAKEISNAYSGGKPVALVNLIKGPNGTNTSTGTKLFVREDGSTEGSLGNSDLDLQAIERALKLMAYGNNEYIVSDNGVEYFIESYTTPPQLVLMGGGHISKAVAAIANTLGFRIFIIDDRPKFSNPERFPFAADTIVAGFDDGLKQIPVNKNTYIIIATRGHRLDDVALETSVNSKAEYIGLIGSKRKTVLIYGELFNRGIPLERIRQVRAPVGINIGARTPEEIAISIMAEILQWRLGGDGSAMKMEDDLILKTQQKAQSSTLVN